MKRSIIYMFATLSALLVMVACSNDDNYVAPIAMATCSDGVMNGDETGVDCGGTCDPCTTAVDFSGTYAQADHMGRPGINTVFGYDIDGQPSVKDAQNVTIPSEMVNKFQVGYQARLEQYYDVYAGLLGINPDDLNYENNILGLDAATLTTVLAADALDVAPDAPTTYFDPGTDANMDGNILVPDGDEVALTGRRLQDDVIDVSLILTFGGMNGDRFSGQDDGNGGNLPRLTSDAASLTATIGTDFPYIGNPQ